jgi:hypothetical protein
MVVESILAPFMQQAELCRFVGSKTGIAGVPTKHGPLAPSIPTRRSGAAANSVALEVLSTDRRLICASQGLNI